MVVAVATLLAIVAQIGGSVGEVEVEVVAVVSREGKFIRSLSSMQILIVFARIFQPGQPATIDSRVSDNSDQALVASFKSLKLNPNELPLRPGFGTAGTSIKLRTNFFPVLFNPNKSFFEYNVIIHPTAGTAIRRVKRRIFQLAENSSDWADFGLRGIVAHDYSSKLIASKELPQPLVIKIQYFDEDEAGPKSGSKEYTLTIEFIQPIDTSALAKWDDFYLKFLV